MEKLVKTHENYQPFSLVQILLFLLMKGKLPFPLYSMLKTNEHPQSVLQHCFGGRG